MKILLYNVSFLFYSFLSKNSYLLKISSIIKEMTIANRQKGDKPPGFTLVFGDSFIGPLKLFKHPRWIFVKFKGGTMKGLTKPDNENRTVIANTINKFIRGNRLNAVIFCFGTVDMQFSYYYSKLMNKPFNPGEIIDGYIQFIKSVVDPRKYKVGIQLAYPSAVSENNMLYQLENYHIMDEFYGFPKRDLSIELTEPERERLIKLYTKIKDTKRPEAQQLLEPDFKMAARAERLNAFNSLMKRKIHGTHIGIINMGQHMVDAHGMVKREFIDPSSVNVHFRWEPQIPFMIREMKYYGLSDKYMGEVKAMIAEEEKYLREKEEELMRLRQNIKPDNTQKTKKKLTQTTKRTSKTKKQKAVKIAKK